VHELAISRSIASIAERSAHARLARGGTVTTVEVDIGHLRQVVPETLVWAWSFVTEGTALDSSRLAVNHIPAVLRCRACGAQTVLTDVFTLTCGTCGDGNVEVISGDEMVVVALIVEDNNG
jgi:hydrogenase nickel incorporation protein HypA/HybF